jgi:Fe-S-cluster containining protein
MGQALPLFYDCLNCPSFCCTYPRIPVTAADIRRLARHHGIDEATAKRRFTKKGEEKGEVVLRHKEDEAYGTACRFLDSETRLCSIHKARPRICRDHPGTSTCAYYNFLMSERRYQDDPEFVARAYNPPEWR